MRPADTNKLLFKDANAMHLAGKTKASICPLCANYIIPERTQLFAQNENAAFGTESVVCEPRALL